MDKNKKKICFISVRSDVGGGTKHMDMLMDYCTQKVYVSSPMNFYYGEKWKKYEYYSLPNRKFSFKKLIGLYFFLIKNNIKIIHSHGFGAGIYSRLLKIVNPSLRIIHTYHGLHFTDYSLIKKFVYCQIEKIFKYLTYRIICISASERDKSIKWKLYHPKKTVVIMGSTKIHRNSYVKRKLNFFNVLWVGRFVPVKNIEMAYEVARLMRDDSINFIFIGNGDTYNKIERNIRHDQLSNIQLLGEQSEEGIDKFLKKSHVLISTSFREGMSLGILEGMERGLPIIATDVEGNNEIISNNKNGYLVGVNDFEKMSYYIRSLRNDETLRESLGRKAMNKVINQHNIMNMVEEVEQLYTSA